MKLKTILLVLFLLVAVPAMAQEEVVEEDAGVTPDSPLWGIDVALEKINLALTFDNKAKAEKGLEIAKERLLEIKLMADEKNIEALAKAETEHGKTVAKVKEDLDELESENETEEIRDVIEIENKIEDHEEELREFKQKVDIKIKGELTAEQQALIDSALNNLDGQIRELKIRVNNKKNRTKIKIKTKTGKTEVEIEKEIGKIEREIMGLKEKHEVKANTFGGQSQIRLKLEFDSEILEVDALVGELIEKFSLDTASADGLLEISDDEGPLGQDRFRVKIDIEEDISEVETEMRFTINSVEREDIVAAIVERSQLTVEDIQGALELRIEDEEEKEDEVECTTDDDCEEGKFCDEGDCEDIEDEEDEIECTVDADCEEGKFCDEGDCEDIEDEEDEVECITDEDCEEDEVCTEGYCEKVEEQECTIDDDCEEGEICAEGDCEKIN